MQSMIMEEVDIKLGDEKWRDGAKRAAIARQTNNEVSGVCEK